MAENLIVNPSSGGVTSISSPLNTLTISQPTGAVLADINLASANTWIKVQSFTADPSDLYAVFAQTNDGLFTAYLAEQDSGYGGLFSGPGGSASLGTSGYAAYFTGSVNFQSQTASTIASFDASKNLISLSTGTYPTLTELSYVKGVTSAIQTQFSNKQNLDATLTALAAYSTNGILTQTASDTFAGRTITGTSNQISVSNGNGVSGNPTLSTPQNIHTAAEPTFAALLLSNSSSGTKIYNTQRTPGGTAGNTIEIGNLAVTTGAGYVEITLVGVTGGNVQGAKYMIPTAYNATGNAWHTVVPVSNQSTYGETVALEMQQGTGNLYFRLRTISAGNPTLNVSVTTYGYASNAWTFTTATATGQSFVAYYKNAFMQQRNNVLDLRNGGYISSAGVDGTPPTTASPGIQVTSTGSMIATENITNPVFTTRKAVFSVPASGNADDVMTITTSEFSSYVEVTLNIHASGYAQSKKYLVPMSYNGTANAWQKVIPLYTTGAYAGNDCDLEINSNTTGTGTARFRLRRSGGSTAATAYLAFVGTGDVANTTYTLLSTSPYAASAPGVNYAPTSVAQLNGLSGVNTDAPTSSWYVNGSFGVSYVAKTGTYTATATDYTIDCTANTFTVNLPTAVGITGRIYVVKNSGAGVITIDGNAAETIDGAATQTLAANTRYTIQSNGANWIIIGS